MLHSVIYGNDTVLLSRHLYVYYFPELIEVLICVLNTKLLFPTQKVRLLQPTINPTKFPDPLFLPNLPNPSLFLGPSLSSPYFIYFSSTHLFPPEPSETFISRLSRILPRLRSPSGVLNLLEPVSRKVNL